jgi:hypothetical protein
VYVIHSMILLGRLNQRCSDGRDVNYAWGIRNAYRMFGTDVSREEITWGGA